VKDPPDRRSATFVVVRGAYVLGSAGLVGHALWKAPEANRYVVIFVVGFLLGGLTLHWASLVLTRFDASGIHRPFRRTIRWSEITRVQGTHEYLQLLAADAKVHVPFGLFRRPAAFLAFVHERVPSEALQPPGPR
jgi:hypothetical protein